MNKYYILLLSFFISISGYSQSNFNGYFDFKYDDTSGKIKLVVDKIDQEFLYVNALAAGVGSNDLGLDRGKLGSTRIVKFIKAGNKILLLQPNQKYRANSKNLKEVKAVEEAFAQSILWAFDILTTEGEKYTIDITPFLLSDANDIAGQLKRSKQGTYKLDKNRTAIYLENTLAFPENVEFESYLTFTGSAEGEFIKSVTPSANAVTVRQHQSFIKLPDAGYQPREFHPYSGFFNISYSDYATPISEPLVKRYITRHRLEKKNPELALSEAKEPIIYYLDSGCPEPVKSALMEGASWWAESFEAAGFKDAFQVKVLPDDAHPLDVRYNVIQWVHRSTRGWSYGASVSDPRTGEIIKGHVSLGSLRVRQDFMIAQGILSNYTTEKESHTLMESMALARLRQLAAHEVGHTIGLAHNFAASTNDRASVMDYPHPYIRMSKTGKIDLSIAYDDKIGIWDNRAIMYGYTELADESDLKEILTETASLGLDYMSDPDARPQGSSHPRAHLWDNGSDPIKELKRLLNLRADALSRFGEKSIANGIPYSELEKVLVPVYLMHRYQTEAVSKLIGGVDYNYAVKGDMAPKQKVVDVRTQKLATQTLLKTLTPQELSMPESVIESVLPAAYGHIRSRESFKSNNGLVFDPLLAAEAYADFTLGLMLNSQRLSRLHQQGGLNDYLDEVQGFIFNMKHENDEKDLVMLVQKVLVIRLINLIKSEDASAHVKSIAMHYLQKVNRKSTISVDWNIHYKYLKHLIALMDDKEHLESIPSLAKMPPGSPIGCE